MTTAALQFARRNHWRWSYFYRAARRDGLDALDAAARADHEAEL